MNERPLRALVLAAGLGTRLGALSDERPKPLIPVCDIALIRYAVALLAGHGVTEVAVNLHHKGELIEAELGSGAELGVTITYSYEPTILGTGGGIVKLADFLTQNGTSDFFVVNGKILVDADLHGLRARHERTGAVATMLLKETPDAAQWGAVETDREGRVLRIIGKGVDGSAVHASMFTGIHVISPRLVDRLPQTGESDSIRHGYLPALSDDERIEGVLLHGYFAEHSTPSRYLEGNLNALYGRASIRYAPGPFTGIDPTAIVDGAIFDGPCRIGPHARIGPGAHIGPGVVIGKGATVGPNVRLERVVVWDGARVDRDMKDAIVTRNGDTFL